jgi:hypothetical protein
MKPSYEILRRSRTSVPCPEDLISRHASFDAAKNAFKDTTGGHHVLVEIYGNRRTVIDASLT